MTEPNNQGEAKCRNCGTLQPGEHGPLCDDCREELRPRILSMRGLKQIGGRVLTPGRGLGRPNR